MNLIGLVDCNNFYASCERVFNPKLEGKPIGILSNNDGCVVARSNEIKPLVAMGVPAHQIPPAIRKQITLLSSNYELYGDMSRRVFDTIRANTADLEIYSIDEAFIHLNGFGNVTEYCKNLRRIVKRNTGIPVSIGISTTKTLAKIANHVAKKNPDYEGVCLLHPAAPFTEELLKNVPVHEIWGVGRRISARLALLNIKTAWQLRQADIKHIRKHFSVTLERTVLELQGTDCIDIGNMDAPKQHIMTSRSFGKLTGDLFDIQEAIRVHASSGAEKLRKQNGVAQAVQVFLKTNPFREDLTQYNPSVVVQLPFATNDSRVIVETALRGLKAIYRKHYLFMKAGVMMLDITDKNIEQYDLFTTPQSEQRIKHSDKLMNVIDTLNKKMGKGTIQLGGTRPKSAWNIKRNMLSNRYTTRWDELPSVK